MKKLLLASAIAVALLAGCQREADVASYNLSANADNFQINRRIVFYNGITGQYMLEIKGLCSLGNNDPVRTLSVTCKVGPDTYRKHFLGLSDNVTYFAEQIEDAHVGVYQYSVNFTPSLIVPDIRVTP